MANTTTGVAVPLKLNLFCEDEFKGRCQAGHWDKESMVVLLLPSGTETTMLQVAEQVKFILEEQKFGRSRSFANHQLHSFRLNVKWETNDMESTPLGYVYLIENEDHGFGPPKMAEKFDAGLRSALQALATRCWRGHMEADCCLILR
jgi:hypothetical protein